MSKESNTSKRIIMAFRLLIKDSWSIRYVICIFGLYFLVGKNFMYSLCPVVSLTGFPCAGCGMTRAAFAVLRGNFALAWKLHPFIYVLGGYVIVFGIQRYIIQREVKSLWKYLMIILVLMIVFYVYRMIRYFPGEPPMSYYYGSVLYQMMH